MDHLNGRGTADRFRHRFQAPQEQYEDNNTDLETKWEHAKQMWTSTCGQVVVRKTAQHKGLTKPATLHRIRIRKDKKAVLSNSLTRAAKAVAQEALVKLTEK